VRPVSVPGATDVEHLLLETSDVALVIERLGEPLANEIRHAEATPGIRAELTCLDDDEQRVVKSVEPTVGVGVQVHAERASKGSAVRARNASIRCCGSSGFTMKPS
jgi:hypothetical protein